MRGSSHNPVPRSCTRCVSTPAAVSACTTGGTASAPSGMKIASAPRAACATQLGRRLHLARIERVALERDDAAAAARHRLLERGLDHVAVGVVRTASRRTSACRWRRRSRRCGRRRTPAGSSADRRRAPRRWRRSRTRSPARRAGARDLRRPTPTECANSGPRMISAPSASACCAACCAPRGVPPSSFTRSWMFGLLNSASAISAAFFIDCATDAGVAAGRQRQDQRDLDLPGADRASAAAAALRRRRSCAVEQSEVPEQAASTPAAASRRAAAAQARADAAAAIGPAGPGPWTISPRRRSQRRRQSTLANGHNEDDRLTKWKG